MTVSVDKLEESSNPKGSTVSANVEFEGKAPVKVRHVYLNHSDLMCRLMRQPSADRPATANAVRSQLFALSSSRMSLAAGETDAR